MTPADAVVAAIATDSAIAAATLDLIPVALLTIVEFSFSPRPGTRSPLDATASNPRSIDSAYRLRPQAQKCHRFGARRYCVHRQGGSGNAAITPKCGRRAISGPPSGCECYRFRPSLVLAG